MRWICPWLMIPVGGWKVWYLFNESTQQTYWMRKNNCEVLFFLPHTWKWNMGPSKTTFLYNSAIFHFHEYGRKSSIQTPLRTPPSYHRENLEKQTWDDRFAKTQAGCFLGPLQKPSQQQKALSNHPPPLKLTDPLKRGNFKRKKSSNHHFSWPRLLVFGGVPSQTFSKDVETHVHSPHELRVWPKCLVSLNSFPG